MAPASSLVIASNAFCIDGSTDEKKSSGKGIREMSSETSRSALWRKYVLKRDQDMERGVVSSE
jgi:hypothetical protein